MALASINKSINGHQREGMGQLLGTPTQDEALMDCLERIEMHHSRIKDELATAQDILHRLPENHLQAVIWGWEEGQQPADPAFDRLLDVMEVIQQSKAPQVQGLLDVMLAICGGEHSGDTDSSNSTQSTTPGGDSEASQDTACA